MGLRGLGAARMKHAGPCGPGAGYEMHTDNSKVYFKKLNIEQETPNKE
jgi:hypothetical protein